MPRILNKIKNPQEDVININTNFDRISLDLADRSGVFSSVAVLSGLTVPSNQTRTIQISVLDVSDIFELNRLPVIPRVDLFVDNDLNGDYFYPAGGSLTQANVHGIQMEIWQTRTVFNLEEDEKATIFVYIRNTDSVSHTFYFYADGYYVPAPEQGVSTRGT